MARQISEETRAKMLEAIAAEKRTREESTMVFGEFRIFRGDSLNYVLQKNESDSTNMYYPTIDFALKQLLREKISAKHKRGVHDILSAIDKAEREVISTLRSISKQK